MDKEKYREKSNEFTVETLTFSSTWNEPNSMPNCWPNTILFLSFSKVFGEKMHFGIFRLIPFHSIPFALTEHTHIYKHVHFNSVRKCVHDVETKQEFIWYLRFRNIFSRERERERTTHKYSKICNNNKPITIKGSKYQSKYMQRALKS